MPLQEIMDRMYNDIVPTAERRIPQMLTNNDDTDISNNRRKRFMELVFEANTSNRGVVQDIMVMIVASTDTVLNGVSMSFYMIAMHQDIQNHIMDEINLIISPMEKISNEHLKKLKYLESVIKESLRIFPPVSFLNRYIDKDIHLDSYKIPKGTEVVISPFYLHRDPQYWPNPLKFDPDRFLPEEITKRHPYCFIPFNGEPRNCIGIEYAMRLMKFFIASLLRTYKKKTKVKSIEEIHIKLAFIMENTPKYPYIS